ncbi:hypothetical protein SNEBB_002830 [Seison nebaliae]|nr:hypothetical protein SNEBB_002830 [Seison nebaliae]
MTIILHVTTAISWQGKLSTCKTYDHYTCDPQKVRQGPVRMRTGSMWRIDYNFPNKQLKTYAFDSRNGFKIIVTGNLSNEIVNETFSVKGEPKKKSKDHMVLLITISKSLNGETLRKQVEPFYEKHKIKYCFGACEHLIIPPSELKKNQSTKFKLTPRIKIVLYMFPVALLLICVTPCLYKKYHLQGSSLTLA